MEKLSFKGLVDKYAVVIPMSQRDYYIYGKEQIRRLGRKAAKDQSRDEELDPEVSKLLEN